MKARACDIYIKSRILAGQLYCSPSFYHNLPFLFGEPRARNLIFAMDIHYYCSVSCFSRSTCARCSYIYAGKEPKPRIYDFNFNFVKFETTFQVRHASLIYVLTRELLILHRANMENCKIYVGGKIRGCFFFFSFLSFYRYNGITRLKPRVSSKRNGVVKLGGARRRRGSRNSRSLILIA